MFEAFDLIRVISLPQRRDRRREMDRELARVGLAGDPRVAYFDAVKPDDAGDFSSRGARGCYLSHLGVLQEARALDASVLIIEDDCDITDAARSYAIDPSCDIFYGGYYAATPENLENSDIVGSHMMGFSRSGVPQVLDYLSDLRVAEGVQHPPIDAGYIWFRRSHPDVKTQFASPPVGNQRPSRSDIEPGAFYNKVFGLRDVVEMVRRIRRA